MIFGKKKYTHQSDEELIEQFRFSADRKYLAELFNRYAHLVYGSCLNYLRNEDAAKDALMLIFEKLLTELKRSKPDNFKAWLYVLTRNHCFMTLRANKRKPEHQSATDLEIADEPSSSLREEQIQQMESLVDKLKPKQALCVKLFYLKELSYAQVALETGLELKEVKTQLQNGRRNLQLMMNQHENHE